MIDGKQVYVTGNDLITLLGSMNASQVDIIEIMDNPLRGMMQRGMQDH